MRSVAIIAALTIGPLAMGQADTRPTQRVQDCTSSGCHAPIVDRPFMHGPTSIGACSACHDYADPAAHTFTLKRQGTALCVFCHIGADSAAGPVLHKPFEEGRCTDCHDPHGSHDRRMLRGESTQALCLSCHDTIAQGEFTHAPAMQGACLACHGAHGSTNEKLLSTTPQLLCRNCHTDVRDRLAESVYAHGPAVENCLNCHDPHASGFEEHLIMPPGRLCLSCHDEVGELAEAAPVKHPPVTQGRGCVQCHDPHGSNSEGMMHDDAVGACLACHAEPMTTADGREIGGVGAIRAEGMSLHGPVALGVCTGCHELHGSEHKTLLAANYTEKFYEGYDEKHYALCFQCHSNELARRPATTVDTRFRNGDKNLHFVHVNKSEQGRTCRACHAPHVSRNPLHIAETVPFGQWNMPLNYAATQTGGSCNAGCHRPASYDRERPTEGIMKRVPGGAAPAPAPDSEASPPG